MSCSAPAADGDEGRYRLSYFEPDGESGFDGLLRPVDVVAGTTDLGSWSSTRDSRSK